MSRRARPDRGMRVIRHASPMYLYFIIDLTDWLVVSVSSEQYGGHDHLRPSMVENEKEKDLYPLQIFL